MSYRWERKIEGRWERVPATALPDTLHNKKAVRFAMTGRVVQAVHADDTTGEYRLVPDDGHDGETDGAGRRGTRGGAGSLP